MTPLFLEKEFGWHVYGEDLLNYVVERDGVSHALLETLDEKKKSAALDWVNYILGSGVIHQKDYVLKIDEHGTIQIKEKNRSANTI